MENEQLIMSFFDNNPILNLVMLGLAIIAIFLAIYFNKRRKPVYIVDTINLIRDKIGKLENINISYLDNEIENLSISKIALWNDGRETIDTESIAPKNPIKVEIDKKYDILDAKIVYQNIVNNFQIDIASDKKTININFDYFDYKEGVVLHIFHTGNDNKNIKISGNIKSVKNIERIPDISKWDDKSGYYSGCIIVMFIEYIISVNILKYLNLSNFFSDVLIFIMVVFWFILNDTVILNHWKYIAKQETRVPKIFKYYTNGKNII